MRTRAGLGSHLTLEHLQSRFMTLPAVNFAFINGPVLLSGHISLSGLLYCGWMKRMMDVRLLTFGVALVAFVVTGSNAQIDVCGIAPLNTRIVGGKDAAPGAWPWMAVLLVNNVPICSGSLINKQWVMTAAQCVDGTFPSSSYSVLLGRNALDTPSPNDVFRKLAKVVPHPQHNNKTGEHDIALLQLSEPVTFTNYIRPVCLAATDSKYYGGRICWITGWGNIKTDVDLPKPRRLQEVDISIMSNQDCKKIFTFITDNHMCTTSSTAGKGTCIGDGGGPLVRKNDAKWVQAGVMTFVPASGCGQRNMPDGYTRVSNYESWISRTIPDSPAGFVLAGTGHLLSLSVPALLSIAVLLLSVFHL